MSKRGRSAKGMCAVEKGVFAPEKDEFASGKGVFALEMSVFALQKGEWARDTQSHGRVCEREEGVLRERGGGARKLYRHKRGILQGFLRVRDLRAPAEEMIACLR